MGFGARYRAQSRQALKAAATPPSGAAPEAIWHQAFDTLTYTSGTTTRLTFFQATNIGSPNLTNMEVAGQFPSPQIFSIYNLCVDIVSTLGVSTDAATLGQANDYYLLLLTGLPTWQLTISNKAYGPYSLSALHGTGGPTAVISQTVATVSQQFATNNLFPGWNYYGRIIIPEQTAFKVDVVWNAAQTLKTASPQLRFSMFGVLSRRVL